jgi:hypothetical protein
MSDLLVSVQKLFEDFDKFEQMESPKQAAFRARLSRFLNQIKDDEIKAVLMELQKQVGVAAPKTANKLTTEDCENEFPKFAEYDTKSRAAYKAKVARLLNEAKKLGDTENSNRLAAIQLKASELEKTEAKNKILALAAKLKKSE